MLYIDLLLSEFGLYQTLNSEDNAREACMGSWFLDVKFTLHLSTLRELTQLCSYTRWRMLCSPANILTKLLCFIYYCSLWTLWTGNRTRAKLVFGCNHSLRKECVDDPFNCGSEARVSNNTDKNNPDAVICMMKETRDMKSNAPIPYPGKILHHSVIHVNILFWNIHGLSQDKLSDNILGSMLKGYDIILLSETWASDHDEFVLEGYEYHNYPRKYRYIISTRHSGGLGVFIRQTIRGGIDIWCHNEDVVAWYILQKSFFDLKKDVYLGNVYIVPENSAYLRHDEFDLLYHYMKKNPDNAEVLLCGDYNARTGEMPDLEAQFCGNNGDLENLLPPEDKETHGIMEHLFDIDMLNRRSMDGNVVNKHGRQLIEFCKATKMLILNGRLGHDRGIGCFTRDDTTGRSVVDYAKANWLLWSVV